MSLHNSVQRILSYDILKRRLTMGKEGDLDGDGKSQESIGRRVCVGLYQETADKTPNY